MKIEPNLVVQCPFCKKNISFNKGHSIFVWMNNHSHLTHRLCYKAVKEHDEKCASKVVRKGWMTKNQIVALRLSNL